MTGRGLVTDKRRRPKRGAKKDKDAESVSLFPMSTEEALADLMKVKPEPKPSPAPKKQRPSS